MRSGNTSNLFARLATRCSRSRQDFGNRTCNASNLWRDRLLAGETFTSAVTLRSQVTAYLVLAELFVAPKAIGTDKLSTFRLITGVVKWDMTIFISAS